MSECLTNQDIKRLDRTLLMTTEVICGKFDIANCQLFRCYTNTMREMER